MDKGSNRNWFSSITTRSLIKYNPIHYSLCLFVVVVSSCYHSTFAEPNLSPVMIVLPLQQPPLLIPSRVGLILIGSQTHVRSVSTGLRIRRRLTGSQELKKWQRNTQHTFNRSSVFKSSNADCVFVEGF